MIKFIRNLTIAAAFGLALAWGLSAADAQPTKQGKYGKSTAPVEAAAPSWWGR